MIFRKHRFRAPLTISQKSLASRCLPPVLTYIRPHILYFVIYVTVSTTTLCIHNWCHPIQKISIRDWLRPSFDRVCWKAWAGMPRAGEDIILGGVRDSLVSSLVFLWWPVSARHSSCFTNPLITYFVRFKPYRTPPPPPPLLPIYRRTRNSPRTVVSSPRGGLRRFGEHLPPALVSAHMMIHAAEATPRRAPESDDRALKALDATPLGPPPPYVELAVKGAPTGVPLQPAKPPPPRWWQTASAPQAAPAWDADAPRFTPGRVASLSSPPPPTGSPQLGVPPEGGAGARWSSPTSTARATPPSDAERQSPGRASLSLALPRSPRLDGPAGAGAGGGGGGYAASPGGEEAPGSGSLPRPAAAVAAADGGRNLKPALAAAAAAVESAIPPSASRPGALRANAPSETRLELFADSAWSSNGASEDGGLPTLPEATRARREAAAAAAAAAAGESARSGGKQSPRDRLMRFFSAAAGRQRDDHLAAGRVGPKKRRMSDGSLGTKLRAAAQAADQQQQRDVGAGDLAPAFCCATPARGARAALRAAGAWEAFPPGQDEFSHVIRVPLPGGGGGGGGRDGGWSGSSTPTATTPGVAEEAAAMAEAAAAMAEEAAAAAVAAVARSTPEGETKEERGERRLSPISSAAAAAAAAVSLFNIALDTGEDVVDAGSREAVLEGLVLPCDPSDEEKARAFFFLLLVLTPAFLLSSLSHLCLSRCRVIQHRRCSIGSMPGHLAVLVFAPLALGGGKKSEGGARHQIAFPSHPWPLGEKIVADCCCIPLSNGMSSCFSRAVKKMWFNTAQVLYHSSGRPVLVGFGFVVFMAIFGGMLTFTMSSPLFYWYGVPTIFTLVSMLSHCE